ncbi:2-succinyl-6-hydroxy-2,4-cyclohexadiene-1-carboxylate synthase [Lysinibacillus telephonicus]|uniref:Putative 2-succinyl-6-hydroxy-2,4-cyclohexadiene-1-carboxylate synthase n=1 Tax=Lysinibacillus telephonicus TaxID=1714840 RepID=A0A3S0I1X2_9BACI|nr:2-succinyl-6-hydroxy-2,4-cyclohexadiene-1-carboxylate synthase [Lysinibacillus telephonicus]RTQ93372.1 2-succinyl-6-hydroxy-2,4-cyclohexadiene-1-carboxylate synthase [Lysinibacillus telephonicus]
MILSVNGIKVHVRIWNKAAEQTIVMLHGFTGTVGTWEQVASYLPNIRIIAIDLIGHGQTEAPEDVSSYTMQAQIKLLEQTFIQLDLEQFVLLGYSMGGRVALFYTVAYPKRVKQLILESASPGLKTEEERAARRMSDEALANKIEHQGIKDFVEMWENIALFATQKTLPAPIQQAVREERLAQTEIGLANSLRGMGTGAQDELWSQLNNINLPVTLITGSLDEKFYFIAQKMIEELPNGEHLLVENTGHAIHVENPKQFATIVEDALKRNKGVIQ